MLDAVPAQSPPHIASVPPLIMRMSVMTLMLLISL